MTRAPRAGPRLLGRREALAAAGGCLALLYQRSLAAATQVGAGAAAGTGKRYAKDALSSGLVEVAALHQGRGRVAIKLFRFDGATWPAHFMVYELPPGASEGVHAHYLDNRNQQGSFDEYYYILGGQGRMVIDGEPVEVVAGDHVHTPLEVAHGIENTHASEPLRVFLTFIQRGSEPAPFPPSRP